MFSNVGRLSLFNKEKVKTEFDSMSPLNKYHYVPLDVNNIHVKMFPFVLFDD